MPKVCVRSTWVWQRGLASLGGEKVEIDELVPDDPRGANCRL
jgi:hypothetical protein